MSMEEITCGYPKTPPETISEMFVFARAIGSLHRFKKGVDNFDDEDRVNLYNAADLLTFPNAHIEPADRELMIRQYHYLTIADKLIPAQKNEDPLNHINRIRLFMTFISESLRAVGDGVKQVTPQEIDADDMFLTDTLGILQSYDLSFEPQRLIIKVN